MKILFLFPLFLILACGRGGDGNIPLQMRLQLPATIAKGSQRYERFIQRVDRLEIKLDSNYEKSKVFNFIPSDWESIQIPDYPFPAKDSDTLKIQISVWDRKTDGTLRNYAVLTGHQEISAQ